MQLFLHWLVDLQCVYTSIRLTHSLDLCLLLAVGSGSAQELRLFYPISASFYVCHAGRDRAGSNGLHCSVASFCVVVVAGRRAHGPGPALRPFWRSYLEPIERVHERASKDAARASQAGQVPRASCACGGTMY